MSPPTGGRIVPADPVDGPTFAVIQPKSRRALPAARPMAAPATCGPPRWPTSTDSADRIRVRLDGVVPLVAEITPAALDELALPPRRPRLGIRQGHRDHDLPSLNYPATASAATIETAVQSAIHGRD